MPIKKLARQFIIISLLVFVAGILMYIAIRSLNHTLPPEESRNMRSTAFIDCLGISLFYIAPAYLLGLLFSGGITSSTETKFEWLYLVLLVIFWFGFHLSMTKIYFTNWYTYSELIPLFLTFFVLKGIHKTKKRTAV